MTTEPRNAARPHWRDAVVFAYLQEPPFCGTGDDGRAFGCDVALARDALQRAGAGPLRFVETAFATLLPGLEDGRWTMTTGLFVTAERARRVAFSRPIWRLADGLMVETGNPHRFTGYAGLAHAANARLAVVGGQVQHQAARAAGVPESRILVCATQDEAARAVRDGRAQAYASVAMAHRGFLAATGLDGLAVVDCEGPAAAGAFAFGPDNAGLAAAVDRALGEILGTPAHRALMGRHGFSAADIDRLAHR